MNISVRGNLIYNNDTRIAEFTCVELRDYTEVQIFLSINNDNTIYTIECKIQPGETLEKRIGETLRNLVNIFK